MKHLKFIIPLALFAVLVGFLMAGLGLNPREVPSPLMNKPAPVFSLPQLDDPAGYIQLARNIASGRGLVSDVLWSYWVSFPAVTHPSNEFWLPLASVVMAASIRLGGDTLLAAQLPGIVAGALLVPLAYGMGRALWPAQRRWAVLAAVLLIPNAALVYQAVSADSSALSVVAIPVTLWDGVITRTEGLVMVACAVVFTIVTLTVSAAGGGGDDDAASLAERRNEGSRILALVLSAVGVLLIVTGSEQFVGGARRLAGEWGISERMLGMTIVALGTSLPELLSAIVAALRGSSSLALGQAIGSNLLNVFLVLGVVAYLHSVRVGERMHAVDAIGLAAITLLAVIFMRGEEFNGKTAQKFLSKIFQKEGPPQVLSGYLCAMRERTLDGGAPHRERYPLPGLL